MMDARIRIHSDGRRYHIRWFCDDSYHWHQVLDDVKYEFEPCERRFEPATRTWSVPLDCRLRVRAWASRWFDADQREYVDGEPPGSGYGNRTYSRGRNRYAQYGETSTSTVDDAYRVLHLYPTAPPELVQAAHRILIKQVHPDRGGSHEEAVRLNAAWALVSRDLERRSA